MATIREVAKKCGVSPMTVSFVLNNKPGQVSAETRERVLRAVRELDYRPAPARQKSEAREVFTLGMVAGVAGDSLMKPGYYNAIANGVLGAADQLRHNVTLFSNSLMHTDTRRSIRVFCDGRCDGLLVLAPPRESKLVAAIAERGLACVLIGDTGDDENISCVDVDNVSGAYRATLYLLEQGHRHIGFLGGPGFVRSVWQRYEGYLQALSAYRISIDPALATTDILRESEIYERAIAMMRLPVDVRPTALFGWNDNVAMHILRALQALGCRVPDEVSVIGFDDDIVTKSALIPLTTMRQPHKEIGRRAVEILLAQIREPSFTPQREFFPAELVVRSTVAPPPTPNY